MKTLMPLLIVGFFIKSAFAVGVDDLGLGDNPYMAAYRKTDSLMIIYTYDKISILEKEYNATVSHEQSFANRMLGAAAIGAGGIGGMMLASGLAEMSADAAAEQDMAAYLATFKCTITWCKYIIAAKKRIHRVGDRFATKERATWAFAWDRIQYSRRDARFIRQCVNWCN